MDNSDPNQEGQVIMPFYIICDVSGSMIPDMRDLNEALSQLRSDIMSEPIVDDLVMLSVITFNHEARVAVPLGAPSTITLPTLSAGGGTEYGKAFQEFHRAFQDDKAKLKAEGKKVYRPCVFFLSDGEPGDRGGYLQTFQSLFGYNPDTKQGNKAFPYIVAFGFRDATEATMKSIAYPNFGPTKGRYFIAKQGATVKELLKSMTGAIGRSVLESGRSSSAGVPQIMPPQNVSNAQFGEADDFVD